jgi:hypothetical protein
MKHHRNTSFYQTKQPNIPEDSHLNSWHHENLKSHLGHRMYALNVLPNVVNEWLTFLFRTQEVPGSNLSTGDQLSWGFSWFSSVPPGKCQDSTLKLSHDHFLPSLFPFIIIHLSPYHRRYTV